MPEDKNNLAMKELFPVFSGIAKDMRAILHTNRDITKTEHVIVNKITETNNILSSFMSAFVDYKADMQILTDNMEASNIERVTESQNQNQNAPSPADTPKEPLSDLGKSLKLGAIGLMTYLLGGGPGTAGLVTGAIELLSKSSGLLVNGSLSLLRAGILEFAPGIVSAIGGIGTAAAAVSAAVAGISVGLAALPSWLMEKALGGNQKKVSSSIASEATAKIKKEEKVLGPMSAEDKQKSYSDSFRIAMRNKDTAAYNRENIMKSATPEEKAAFIQYQKDTDAEAANPKVETGPKYKDMGSTANLPTKGNIPAGYAQTPPPPKAKQASPMNAVVAQTPPPPKANQGNSELKSSEGFVTKAAPDPVGFMTIGYGHKLTEKELSSGIVELPSGRKVNWKSDSITKEEASSLMEQDKSGHDSGTVNQLKKLGVNTDSLSESVKAGVFDLGYNAGPGIFKKAPKLVAALKANDEKAIASELRTTATTADGVKLNGLVARRGKYADAIEASMNASPAGGASSQVAASSNEAASAQIAMASPVPSAGTTVISNTTNNSSGGQNSAGSTLLSSQTNQDRTIGALNANRFAFGAA